MAYSAWQLCAVCAGASEEQHCVKIDIASWLLEGFVHPKKSRSFVQKAAEQGSILERDSRNLKNVRLFSSNPDTSVKNNNSVLRQIS